MTLQHTLDICLVQHRRNPDKPRRAIDGGYICTGCADGLLGNLKALPGLYADLGEQQAYGRAGGGQRVGGTTERALPITPALAAHRDDIRQKLGSWCRVIVDDWGLTPPPNDKPGVTARYLIAQFQRISTQQWAVELVEEIVTLTATARAMLNPAPTRIEVGERCRVVPEGEERCDGTVSMTVSDEGLWSARCSECGRQEPADYMRDKLAGRLVDMQRVREYALREHGISVQAATVRDWVRRERIQGGDGWYDLGTVDRYLRERAARAEKVGA